MSELQLIGGEKFNVEAILRHIDAEAKAAYGGSERTMIELIARLIRAQQTEREKLLLTLVHIGDQACEGTFTEHGDCPATFACSAIIAELIDLGMPPKGVVPVQAMEPRA